MQAGSAAFAGGFEVRLEFGRHAGKRSVGDFGHGSGGRGRRGTAVTEVAPVFPDFVCAHAEADEDDDGENEFECAVHDSSMRSTRPPSLRSFSSMFS